MSNQGIQITQTPIESLIPYARNARTHSDAQVAQIAASIKEFGWTNPILTDGNNGVIAGHGRLLAARNMGMDKVPVIELSEYALEDIGEFIAEGWSEFRNNANPNILSKKIGSIVLKKYTELTNG